ncbi:MAG: hypothetical protein ACSHX8_09035 [Opitutaceae bacterium]
MKRSVGSTLHILKVLYTLLMIGFVLGALACLVTALLWMAITLITDYQIGWMAVILGFLVGHSVRLSLNWRSELHGFMAGGFSLLGCVLGNCLSAIVLLAREDGISVSLAISNADWESTQAAMELFFMPVDVLFYALALIQGFAIGRGSDMEEPETPWLSRGVVSIVVILGAALLTIGVWGRQVPRSMEIQEAVVGLTSKLKAQFYRDRVVELTDVNGRSLQCVVDAKDGSHVLITRSPGEDQYLLNMNRLDSDSRLLLAGMNDTNEQQVADFAYPYAAESGVVEVIRTNRGLSYRRSCDGKMCYTDQGAAVESLKTLLDKNGIRYRERAPLEEPSSNPNVSILLESLPKLPCLQVGGEYFVDIKSDKFKECLLSAYYSK